MDKRIEIRIESPLWFLVKIYSLCILLTCVSIGGVSDAAANQHILRMRAEAVMASIPDIQDQFPSNLISATALYKKLQNPQESAQLFLIDTRQKNEWNQGHIKGAVSIQFQKMAEPESLAILPKDKLIVCISSTGHTAVQAVSVLRWLGYRAILLEHGMGAWMSTHAGGMMRWDVTNGITKRYPIVKITDRDLAAPNHHSVLKPPKNSEIEYLQASARKLMRNNIFNKKYPFNHIFADDLARRLRKPQIMKSLFLLDIRSAASRRTNGAIKGSTAIDWRQIGRQENLDKLPQDKVIVVICHTGQTSGQVTPILRMLGFNAVTLRSGMTAWTETSDSHRTLDALCSNQNPCSFPFVR